MYNIDWLAREYQRAVLFIWQAIRLHIAKYYIQTIK